MNGVVFAFFGHPGAGKSTLCRRFGELCDVPAIDTDALMTPAEVAAVESGRYTQTMRLANVRRYCRRARSLLRSEGCVAIADGLPNAESRRFLREQLASAEVVFVLVTVPRALWEARLAARSGNAVNIGIAAAEAYVRENWEEIEPSPAHETIENGADGEATDAALQVLYRRHVPAASG